MSLSRRVLFAFAVVLGASFSASAATRGGRTAAWVVRDRITSPEAVAEVCRAAREARVDTLVVQVRGRGDAYYETDLVPRAVALAKAPADFDPLAEVIRQAKGMRVVAWLNVFFVWSGDTLPPEDEHVFWLSDEWGLEDRNGRDVWTYTAQERALGWIEGIYVDPASAAYRKHFAELAAEVASNYRVDGIHLDFVRYPGPGYGKGGPLGSEFQKAWGFDPRWIPEKLEAPSVDTLVGGSGPLSRRVLSTGSFLWKDLRAKQVTELVRTVRKRLRAGPRRVELSAAVFPALGNAYLSMGQDWAGWASQGLIDAVFPMAYFGGEERVGMQLQEIAEVLRTRAPKVLLWAGLGGYIKDPAQIGRESRRAWELGYDGVCLFDLGSLCQKAGGAKAYFESVTSARGARASGRPKLDGARGWKGPSAPLFRAIDKASGGQLRWTREKKGAVGSRWSEFDRARRGPIARVVASLEGAGRPEPEWAELKGVFRYVSPGDSPERRLEQQQAAEAVRARLLAGEDIDAVAKEVSQSGNRKWGGSIGRRYLDPSEPSDALLLGLAPGELTPVVETPSGYWVYRLEARGGGETMRVDEMSWPARRMLFLRELSAQMDRE